jgi:outer membrane protein
MKKFFLTFGVMVGLALSAELKIGYIDSDRIFREYQAASETKQTFEMDLGKFKSQAEEMQHKYDVAKSEYDAQKLMLSEEARTAKEGELANLHQQYENYVQEVYGKGGKIELKNAELMAPLVKQINTVVQTIAQAEGFTLILDMAPGEIIYAQPGLDLTDKVITELNKEYQPITIAPAFKQQIAVFYLVEQNSDAKNSHLGKTGRDIIEKIINNQFKTKMEIVDHSKIINVLQTKGLPEEAVDDITALDVGRQVNADFTITGSVKQDGKEITVELKLTQVKFNRTYPAESQTAAKIDVLSETVANVLQSLINKYVQ